MRASVFLEVDDKNILIDCGPDFRAQMLFHGIDKIDSILLTHKHIDHIGGIDDLRPLGNNKIYLDKQTGTPDCFIEAVIRGVDMFDCVLQTRAARNGLALTRKGRIMLRNQTYAEDFSPIEEGCDCYACQNFSRAYIRHLIKAEEILSGTLITMHNIRFSVRLMADIRQAIAEDRFGDFARELLEVKLF